MRFKECYEIVHEFNDGSCIRRCLGKQDNNKYYLFKNKEVKSEDNVEVKYATYNDLLIGIFTYILSFPKNEEKIVAIYESILRKCNENIYKSVFDDINCGIDELEIDEDEKEELEKMFALLYCYLTAEWRYKKG